MPIASCSKISVESRISAEPLQGVQDAKSEYGYFAGVLNSWVYVPRTAETKMDSSAVILSLNLGNSPVTTF